MSFYQSTFLLPQVGICILSLEVLNKNLPLNPNSLPTLCGECLQASHSTMVLFRNGDFWRIRSHGIHHHHSRTISEKMFWFTHFFHPHRSDRVANLELQICRLCKSYLRRWTKVMMATRARFQWAYLMILIYSYGWSTGAPSEIRLTHPKTNMSPEKRLFL